MAGSGTWLTIQDVENGPLICRHQLSTNVSTIAKRELSINKSVDWAAKFYRSSLKNPIGTENLTQSLVDSLATRIQGINRYLEKYPIVQTASLSSIEIDSTNADTLNIVVLLSPLYPCNYIKLTLNV